jgi:hypothetical protein
MQRCPRSVKHMGATWGISGDVCHMCILCFFAGTLTTTAYSRFVRTDYGDECDYHRLYLRLIYYANFYFGEERVGPICVMTLHMHVHE